MASFSLNFTGVPTSQVPVNSTNRHTTARRIIDLFLMLTYGRFKGAVTMTASNPAAAASATVVFTGEPTAADTVTINGVALTAQQSYARGTVTAASVQAADTVTVGSIVFTAVNGGTPTNIQFDMSGSNSATATNIAAAINAHPTTQGLVKAYAASAVVTVRNLVIGTAGNHAGLNAVAFTSSNNTRLAVAGTSSGKLDGASAPGNNLFDFGNTLAEAAANFAAAVNASTTALVSGSAGVSAASNGVDTVTLTAKVLGATGNAITLAKSSSAISSVSARLSGGSDTLSTYVF